MAYTNELREVPQSNKLAKKTYVNKYTIAGTDLVVYDVLEPIDSYFCLTHSSLTSHSGMKLGKMSSRRLPEHLDALPAMTRERSDAVNEWHKNLYAMCYDAILQAYPEILNEKNRRATMGSIETW